VSLRFKIAEELLGSPVDANGYTTCPGQSFHTHRNGKRDFRIFAEGAPYGHCVHSSCAGAVEEWNREFQKKVWFAENGGKRAAGYEYEPGVAARPVRPRGPRRPAYEAQALVDAARKVPGHVDVGWLKRVSPIDPARVGPAEFVGGLYEDGERVLLFEKQYSQGDYLWWVGKGGYRLAHAPGVKAVRSEVPVRGKEGIWFLTNPVTGQWVAHEGKKTRRSWPCVTAWRYLVLESDEAPPGLWVKFLASILVPVVAVYGSGGKSYHALVRVDAGSREEWDARRDQLLWMCRFGADGAAMSSVRLSRWPGALRMGTCDRQGNYVRYAEPRRQELVYFDPNAAVGSSILERRGAGR
jgi:hypothetical protein